VAKLRNQYLSVFLEHTAFGARGVALESLARGFIGTLVVGCTANKREQQQTNKHDRLGKSDTNITNEQGRSDSCLVIPSARLHKLGSEEECDEQLSKQERESVTLVAFERIIPMAIMSWAIVAMLSTLSSRYGMHLL
jgi:hypothetical protein